MLRGNATKRSVEEGDGEVEVGARDTAGGLARVGHKRKVQPGARGESEEDECDFSTQEMAKLLCHVEQFCRKGLTGRRSSEPAIKASRKGPVASSASTNASAPLLAKPAATAPQAKPAPPVRQKTALLNVASPTPNKSKVDNSDSEANSRPFFERKAGQDKVKTLADETSHAKGAGIATLVRRNGAIVPPAKKQTVRKPMEEPNLSNTHEVSRSKPSTFRRTEIEVSCIKKSTAAHSAAVRDSPAAAKDRPSTEANATPQRMNAFTVQSRGSPAAAKDSCCKEPLAPKASLATAKDPRRKEAVAPKASAGVAKDALRKEAVITLRRMSAFTAPPGYKKRHSGHSSRSPSAMELGRKGCDKKSETREVPTFSGAPFKRQRKESVSAVPAKASAAIKASSTQQVSRLGSSSAGDVQSLKLDTDMQQNFKACNNWKWVRGGNGDSPPQGSPEKVDDTPKCKTGSEGGANDEYKTEDEVEEQANTLSLQAIEAKQDASDKAEEKANAASSPAAVRSDGNVLGEVKDQQKDDANAALSSAAVSIEGDARDKDKNGSEEEAKASHSLPAVEITQGASDKFQASRVAMSAPDAQDKEPVDATAPLKAEPPKTLIGRFVSFFSGKSNASSTDVSSHDKESASEIQSSTGMDGLIVSPALDFPASGDGQYSQFDAGISSVVGESVQITVNSIAASLTAEAQRLESAEFQVQLPSLPLDHDNEGGSKDEDEELIEPSRLARKEGHANDDDKLLDSEAEERAKEAFEPRRPTSMLPASAVPDASEDDASSVDNRGNPSEETHLAQIEPPITGAETIKPESELPRTPTSAQEVMANFKFQTESLPSRGVVEEASQVPEAEATMALELENAAGAGDTGVEEADRGDGDVPEAERAEVREEEKALMLEEKNVPGPAEGGDGDEVTPQLTPLPRNLPVPSKDDFGLAPDAANDENKTEDEEEHRDGAATPQLRADSAPPPPRTLLRPSSFHPPQASMSAPALFLPPGVRSEGDVSSEKVQANEGVEEDGGAPLSPAAVLSDGKASEELQQMEHVDPASSPAAIGRNCGAGDDEECQDNPDSASSPAAEGHVGNTGDDEGGEAATSVDVGATAAPGDKGEHDLNDTARSLDDTVDAGAPPPSVSGQGDDTEPSMASLHDPPPTLPTDKVITDESPSPIRGLSPQPAPSLSPPAGRLSSSELKSDSESEPPPPKEPPQPDEKVDKDDPVDEGDWLGSPGAEKREVAEGSGDQPRAATPLGGDEDCVGEVESGEPGPSGSLVTQQVPNPFVSQQAPGDTFFTQEVPWDPPSSKAVETTQLAAGDDALPDGVDQDEPPAMTQTPKHIGCLPWPPATTQAEQRQAPLSPGTAAPGGEGAPQNEWGDENRKFLEAFYDAAFPEDRHEGAQGQASYESLAPAEGELGGATQGDAEGGEGAPGAEEDEEESSDEEWEAGSWSSGSEEISDSDGEDPLHCLLPPLHPDQFLYGLEGGSDGGELAMQGACAEHSSDGGEAALRGENLSGALQQLKEDQQLVEMARSMNVLECRTRSAQAALLSSELPSDRVGEQGGGEAKQCRVM